MSVKKLLMEAALKYGERDALFAGGKKFSYNGLYRKAYKTAAALYENGFRPGDFCGVLGMRNAQTYWAILGIILAGGCYVPTNPSYPTQRNLKILDASGAAFAVFDPAYEENYSDILKNRPHLKIIIEEENLLPSFMEKFPENTFIIADKYDPAPPPIEELRDDNFIYLLFTSGSTGEPKGVAITHGNLENYLNAAALRHTTEPEDRFIQLFDLTFDLSAHPFFLSLTKGASLWVADDASLLNPAKFLREHKITHWASVPTAAAIMAKMRLLKPGAFPHIKYSMFCGEALSYDLTALWSEAAPNSVVENLYGPTEATVACLYHRFDKNLSKKYSVNGIVPIGNPMDGMKILVGDENMNPAPRGVTGELFLAGRQLAKGYFNDRKKTEEKFVSLEINGERDIYYKTGDLVKLSEAGAAFIGRSDTQIKIRGYRTELSEIENAAARISRAPITAALPVPPEGPPAGVAVFILDTGEWTKEEVLEGCAKVLPSYMTPSQIIPLKEFPRNSSGKIDRNKLKELL